MTAPDNRLQAPLGAAFDAVPVDWRGVTEPFRHSEIGARLCAFVDRRVAEGAPVFPAQVFHALSLTAPAEVRVVILGQDPYHGPGQAQGLAFSVARGMRVPPSLRNMLSEVATDTGRASVCRDELIPWATQGVLLLNSVLTVEEGRPQSHARQGWEALTGALLARIAAQALPVVFMLWGASAQGMRPQLQRGGHRVLVANHPSPLSARRGPQPFVGCRHFSQANEFLATHWEGPSIRW